MKGYGQPVVGWPPTTETTMTKYQVREEDFVYGNGITIDPVLYDTYEEAMSHCHSYRGTVHKVEVEAEQV